jgi:hypothetical protein
MRSFLYTFVTWTLTITTTLSVPLIINYIPL